METISQRRETTEKRLRKIARGRKVAHVLERYDVTTDELFKLHEYLERANLYDISFEIINSPAELEALIQLQRDGTPPIEAIAVFRHFQ